MQQSMFGSVTSVRTCSKCGGTGKVVKDPCNTCHGSGKVRKTKKYEVNVPKGIDNGQTIRLAGKGEIGENGGGYGDLLIFIVMYPFPSCRRHWAVKSRLRPLMVRRNIPSNPVHSPIQS